MNSSLLIKREFLATVYTSLSLAGYFLFNSLLGLLVDDIQNNQFFNIFFRGFMFLFSLVMIFACAKSNIRLESTLKVYFLFFALFLIRALYDLFLNPDFNFDTSPTNRFLLFSFVITLIPSIAFLYLVEHINLNKLLFQLVVFINISILASYFTIELNNTDQRLYLGQGIGVLATGYFAVMQILLTFFIIKKKILKNNLLKLIILFISIISLRILFLSGSRGPFFALLIILFLFNLSYKNLKYITALFFLLLIFSNQLIIFLSQNYQIFLNRVLYNETIGGRFFLYEEALNIFFQNPFFGNQFALEAGYNGFIYCHNILLDSMISLGIIGLILILVVLKNIASYSYNSIKRNNYTWLVMLLALELLKLFVSSSFYQNERFSYLLVILFTLKKINENFHLRTKIVGLQNPNL